MPILADPASNMDYKTVTSSSGSRFRRFHILHSIDTHRTDRSSSDFFNSQLKEIMMMNLKKKTISMLAMGMLFAAMSVSAQAEKQDNWGSNLPLSALSGPMKNTVELYGNAIPAEAATRQITLTPNTKWINVTRGDSVNFVAGGKSFAWNFYTLRSETSFDLAMIAPKDINVQQIRVYVAKKPGESGR